jgi:hypothetical protein
MMGQFTLVPEKHDLVLEFQNIRFSVGEPEPGPGPFSKEPESVNLLKKIRSRELGAGSW